MSERQSPYAAAEPTPRDMARILDEIATEEWSVEAYRRDEVAMYIKSGPHRILSNVNLECEEMHAVAMLPRLVRQLRQAEQERNELREVLKQIAWRDDTEMAAARTLHYDMRGWARAALAATQETP